MTTLTDKQLADLRARITKGPWKADGPPWNRIIWSEGENRVCFMAHSNGLNDDRDIATSELIAMSPDLLDEVMRQREAFSNCRKWPFHVIPMPFTADGKGPATIGVDAAQIAYEVWGTDYICHASFDNLPDAINEAMRLTVAALTTEKNDG